MSGNRRRARTSRRIMLPGQRVVAVNGRKLLVVAIALISLGALAAIALLSGGSEEAPIAPTKMDAALLTHYFNAQFETGESWELLAALEEAQSGKTDGSVDISALTAQLASGDTAEKKLANAGSTIRRRVLRILPRYSIIAEISKDKGFPFEPNVNYDYVDSWGTSREFGGERSHEGTDMFAAYGERIVSVSDGVIEKLGWNQLGGWRVGVRAADGVYYYYAHMSEYAEGLSEGQSVKRGDLLGYVGDSGYGPEGTTGMFEAHLHFGMYWGYGDQEKAFNAYPYLCLWEMEGK